MEARARALYDTGNKFSHIVSLSFIRRLGLDREHLDGNPRPFYTVGSSRPSKTLGGLQMDYSLMEDGYFSTATFQVMEVLLKGYPYDVIICPTGIQGSDTGFVAAMVLPRRKEKSGTLRRNDPMCLAFDRADAHLRGTSIAGAERRGAEEAGRGGESGEAGGSKGRECAEKCGASEKDEEMTSLVASVAVVGVWVCKYSDSKSGQSTACHGGFRFSSTSSSIPTGFQRACECIGRWKSLSRHRKFLIFFRQGKTLT